MGMDPFSWLLIGGAVMAAGGAAMQVNTTMQQADAKKQEGRQVRQVASYQAGQIYNQYSDVMAKQVTAFANNGVAESGSALDIEAQEAYNREVAVRMKLYEGELGAWKDDVEADNLKEKGWGQAVGGMSSIMGLGIKAFKPGKGGADISNDA